MSISINGKNFNEEEYERLLNLVNEGGKFNDIKRAGLESIYSAFRDLAVLYLDQYTNLDKKRLRHQTPGAVKALIKHQIFSEEDIRTKIPVCPYCNTGKHVIPNSKNNGEFVGHCGNRKCMGMYKKDLIEERVEEKYGVKNISSLDSMKKLKSEKLRDAYARKGEEINEKRRKTVQKKYGVDNVSQLNEVKAKKGQTFTEHYGVDNIFKRNDLMKQYWKEKLGVENPIFDPVINRKRVKHMSKGSIIDALPQGYRKKINGKEYIFASKSEETALKYVYKALKHFAWYADVYVNEVVLPIANDDYHMYIADIMIDDYGYIEVKGKASNESSILNVSFKSLEKAIYAALYNNYSLLIYLEKEDVHAVLYLSTNGDALFAYNLLKEININPFVKLLKGFPFTNLVVKNAKGLYMEDFVRIFIKTLQNKNIMYGNELEYEIKKINNRIIEEFDTNEDILDFDLF